MKFKQNIMPISFIEISCNIDTKVVYTLNKKHNQKYRSSHEHNIYTREEVNKNESLVKAGMV